MLFIIIVSVYLILIWKHKSVSTYLAILYLFTIIAAYYLNYTPNIITIEEVLSLIFIIINLMILILPFVKYRNVSYIKVPHEHKLARLSKIVLIINVFAFIVSLIFVIVVWTTVDEFSLFKGQQIYQQEVFSSSPISTKYLTLSSFFASTSYISLGFHFYYLSKSQYKKAILFLIASLSLPLRMLVYFSRSALFLFVSLYIAYTILFYKSFNDKSKKVIKSIFLSIIALVSVIFIIISINRFSSGDNIDSGTILAILDYSGQWYKHGIELLSQYNFNPLNGELSDSFIDWIQSFISSKTDPSNREVRMKIWPNHYYKFNGLITILVYDFGLFFTCIFCLLYMKIVYSLRPIQGQISIFSTLIFGVLITLPMMNFTGNYLEDHLYGSAIFFSILIYLYFKFKL